ncbi:MAG: 50S ribosomal protein L24 [Candidatus Limnocylindrales bacterium]
MAADRGAPSNKVPEIRKGDTVVVLHGKDAGKHGTVERILRNPTAARKNAGHWRTVSSRTLSVVISGVNIAKRHQKARPRMSQTTQAPAQQGGIVDKPMPIDASNVMIVCPRCDRITRVKHERLGSGESVRVCGHCREQLEAGA